MEYVVLVTEKDMQTGIMEKLEAHQKGLLHRAISVFIYNSNGEMLLQKRAAAKYHSANLWTNTCCTHPRQGETVAGAAARRLSEEMGMKCDLTEITSFIYKAQLENNLVEHEFDHVFVGVTDDLPMPDPAEVADWKYLHKKDLIRYIQEQPEQYTEWFKICIRDLGDKI